MTLFLRQLCCNIYDTTSAFLFQWSQPKGFLQTSDIIRWCLSWIPVSLTTFVSNPLNNKWLKEAKINYPIISDDSYKPRQDRHLVILKLELIFINKYILMVILICTTLHFCLLIYLFFYLPFSLQFSLNTHPTL